MNIEKLIADIEREADKICEQFSPPQTTSATSMADVRGVSADQAPHVDWSSGKGPQTDLGKRAKKKIVRRKLFGAALMNDPRKT